jgi:putative PIN family toxin of toxin-antitoxin system
VFVSGFLTRTSPPALLIHALRAKAFTLILAEPLSIELIFVLHRPRVMRYIGVTPAEVEDFLLFAHRNADIVSPSSTLLLTSRDPKDDKFLAAAVAGNADYLVTGDNDLLALRDDPALGGLKIVSVGVFLGMLRW